MVQGSPLDVSGGSFTCMVWLNLTSLAGGTGDRAPVGVLSPSKTNGWFIDHISGTGICLVFYGVGQTGNQILSTGVWYCIFAWYDGANQNISVNNGAAVTGATAPSKYAADQAGFRVNPAANFDGIIGPTALWKGRVLTSTERTYLYNAGIGYRLF
jgi:hypothetical protein